MPRIEQYYPRELDRALRAIAARTAELRVGMPVREVHLVDLMERRTRELPARDGRIPLEFGPYEIHTIALTPGGTRGG
jgi:hypothetical protein